MTCRPPGELFGRANELARLHILLVDAMTGRPRVVLCAGEPGIGKTALLDRFADEAATRGVRVLRARSFGSAGATAILAVASGTRRPQFPRRPRFVGGSGSAR